MDGLGWRCIDHVLRSLPGMEANNPKPKPTPHQTPPSNPHHPIKQHLGEYFSAVGRLLKPGGIFVMEAITTPESRYKEYLKARASRW